MITKIMAKLGWVPLKEYQELNQEYVDLSKDWYKTHSRAQSLRAAVQLYYDTVSPDANDYLLDCALGEFDAQD